MPKLTSTDEHGNLYEVGTIESVHLGKEDHGIFSFGLIFRFEGSGQGTGLYGLPEDDATSIRLLRTVSEVVGPLLEAKGKKVWVIRESGSHFGKIIGIAPLQGEPLFFADIFAEDSRYARPSSTDD